MKPKCVPPTLTHRRSAALAALAFASSLTVAQAAENILWTWDDPDIRGSWGTAWGQAQVTQDPLEDNTGNGGGSLYITTDFAGNPPDDNRNVITVMGNFGGWLWNGDVRNDLTEYESLEFDIKWDAANATIPLASFNDTDGDDGLVIWSTRNTGDWEWIQFGQTPIPEAAATGWAHVSIPIDPTTAGLDSSAGVAFKKWVQQGIADAGGIAAFWIDNVELVAGSAPVPPPTLALSSQVRTGLNLITVAGSEWQRQGIRTVGDNFSWVGATTPTTYEYTVTELPGGEYAGFATIIFLVPQDPRSRTDPDWGYANVIRYDMSEQADGSCLATFRFKLDAPDSNGGMYGGDGELGSVSSTTALGRWGFTFADATHLTIFSPEASTELVLPDAVAAKFDDAVTAYFVCMPNAPARVGQKAVFSQARIEGTVGGTTISDDFPGPLNTETWELNAAHPSGIVVVDDDAALWLKWSLPDSGFMLQAAGQVPSATWNAFGGSTPPLATGPNKSVLIRKSELPNAQQTYWRLAKRQFTKLQVLLPGETAAPGTLTGKTGTPDPQQLFIPFEIRINAVSDDWTVMNEVTDTVAVTSTDAQALLPEPAALVNGTVTLSIDPGTAGAQTFTVSNETNPAIAPATSAPVTVSP